MKKIDSLREVQLIELNILKFIDRVCEKNHLRYFLAGGTLLGAIRHKGFIPWDNDMDISMPRPDYDKFAQIATEEAQNFGEPYELLALSNQGKYCCPFIKVVDNRTFLKDGDHQKYKGGNMGVFVDIFPIDGLESNKEENVAKILKIRNKCINISLSFAKFDNLNIREAIKLMMYKLAYSGRNREQLLEKTQDMLRLNNFYNSNYVISTFGMRGKKEVIRQEYFAKTIKVQFENGLFPAPVGYREYLTKMYGDYMQLPPEEKRIAPHDYEEYWKE